MLAVEWKRSARRFELHVGVVIAYDAGRLLMFGPYESAVSLKSAPSSTARCTAALAAFRFAGSPRTASPTMRMARSQGDGQFPGRSDRWWFKVLEAVSCQGS